MEGNEIMGNCAVVAAARSATTQQEEAMDDA
jgi:hypothetical protein